MVKRLDPYVARARWNHRLYCSTWVIHRNRWQFITHFLQDKLYLSRQSRNWFRRTCTIWTRRIPTNSHGIIFPHIIYILLIILIVPYVWQFGPILVELFFSPPIITEVIIIVIVPLPFWRVKSMEDFERGLQMEKHGYWFLISSIWYEIFEYLILFLWHKGIVKLL